MSDEQAVTEALVLLDEPDTEVEPYTPAKILGGIPHLQEYILLAESISRTAMVPSQFRNKPQECLAVMLYGAEVGIGPMQALQQINFIAGKPSMAAELLRALVMQAGHQIILSGDDKVAIAQCKRIDWTDWRETTFTIDDAARAKLIHGDGWQKYPDQMLAARVTSKACRMFFADVIAGMSYVPEEIEAFSTPAPPALDERAARRTTIAPPGVEPDVPEGAITSAQLIAVNHALDGFSGDRKATLNEAWKIHGLPGRDLATQEHFTIAKELIEEHGGKVPGFSVDAETGEVL